MFGKNWLLKNKNTELVNKATLYYVEEKYCGLMLISNFEIQKLLESLFHHMAKPIRSFNTISLYNALALYYPA